MARPMPVPLPVTIATLFARRTNERITHRMRFHLSGDVLRGLELFADRVLPRLA
jgi:hypothetical protein